MAGNNKLAIIVDQTEVLYKIGEAVGVELVFALR